MFGRLSGRPFFKEIILENKPTIRKIINPQFNLAEQKRVIWHAEPAEGVTIKDMLNPIYWTHVAANLAKGARIEAVSEDGTWFAEFYVKSANKIEAHVTLMREVQLSKAVAKLKIEPKFKVNHVGGGKWRVLRTEDNAELQTGFKSKEAAQTLLLNKVRATWQHNSVCTMKPLEYAVSVN